MTPSLAQAQTAKKKEPGLFDFESWKSPAARERDAARQLEPGKLDVGGGAAANGPLRTIRLRVYADRDYRMIVVRWQRRLHAQIDRINAAAEPLFGVHFEIESLREWDRSHTGASFEAILVDLEAQDPAREVDWVLGLVTPLRGVAANIHQIGGARLLSRHLVMRGMDDEQEILALERELKLLTPDERQDLYSRRRAHKEVVIFLHEWGHSLGLLHHEEPTAIMNPNYDPRQAAFSPFEKQIASLVIERRLARPQELYPESAALEPLLAASPGDEGSDGERALLLDLVRQRARAGSKRSGAASPGLPAGTTEADIDGFNRAVEAANDGRTEPAWRELSPVAHHLDAAQAGADAAFTMRVAELAARVGALTVAESLLGRANRRDAATMKLAGEIDSIRHRVALPAGADALGVPVEREPAFVAGFWETTRLIDKDPAAARARLDQLAADFPGAPGVDVLACDLGMRAKKRAAASQRCQAALAKFDGATRALALRGLLAAEAGRQALAEKDLRRAILLDPEDPGAWQILGQLYRATHATSRLTELDKEHQALFSSPLPK